MNASSTPAPTPDDWERPALLQVSYGAEVPDPLLNDDCPEWCDVRGDHKVEVTSEPGHFSQALYARTSRHTGYFRPDKAIYAHMLVRLRSWRDRPEPVIELVAVHGDHDMQRTTSEATDLTLAEARNLIVALQHMVKVAS